MTSAEAQDRITHAFQVERILTRLDFLVLGIGAASLAGIVVLWLDAQIALTTAMGAAAATLAGTVLAGAGAYGSGTKIGIAASQFALAEQRFSAAPGPDADPTNYRPHTVSGGPEPAAHGACVGLPGHHSEGIVALG